MTNSFLWGDNALFEFVSKKMKQYHNIQITDFAKSKKRNKMYARRKQNDAWIAKKKVRRANQRKRKKAKKLATVASGSASEVSIAPNTSGSTGIICLFLSFYETSTIWLWQCFEEKRVVLVS